MTPKCELVARLHEIPGAATEPIREEDRKPLWIKEIPPRDPPGRDAGGSEGYATRVHIAGVDEEPLPLAGPGAPLVREFCVAEFAAAIGMGTESGKYYLGSAAALCGLPPPRARLTPPNTPPPAGSQACPRHDPTA